MRLHKGDLAAWAPDSAPLLKYPKGEMLGFYLLGKPLATDDVDPARPLELMHVL